MGNLLNPTENTPPTKPLRHLFEARRPKPAALKINISGPAIQFTSNMAFSPSLDFSPRQPQEEHNLQPQAAAVGLQESTYDNSYADKANTMISLEGFPHIGPCFPTLDIPNLSSQAEHGNYLRPASLGRFIQADKAPATPNQLSRQICCVNRCRGGPRADKCLFCLFDIPEAHFFVRSLVEQWHAGEDIVAAFAARPVAIDFGEVDDFGDTVLHLASSLGAGTIILSRFISMGVNVHAKNVAGQTFMHVFDPVAFARCGNRDFSKAWYTGKEDMAMLLNVLQGMNFDFNARDDFGQTPMHVFTQHWLPVHTMQLAFEAGMAGGSMLFNKDFQGRSVESRIRAQANVDHNKALDLQRKTEIDTLLYLMKPLATMSSQPNKNFSPLADSGPQEENVSDLHAALRKTIIEATSIFPETRYRGRNALHCLAESCISLQLESQDQDTAGPQLKRKRQAETTLRHEYIVNTVKKLLDVGVDPNDYDKCGNTPLVAFIINDLSPKPERKITAEVLQLLIDAGASVHRRNHKGETALHIAMRLGRPSAVEVLLNNYANVHSRARHGEGILAVAGKASLMAKQDEALYHRVITCMAIAGKYGAVLGPSTKDEWDRQRKCVNKEGPVIIEGPQYGDDDMKNVQ